MNLFEKTKRYSESVRTLEDDVLLMGDLNDIGSGDITNKIKED